MDSDRNLIPEDRKNPQWADFLSWFNEYYTQGEHGVIYSDLRSPDILIKVVNVDITDGWSNADQADFFEDNWKRNVEGLVDVYAFARSPVVSAITNKLKGCVLTTSADYQSVMNVFELENGDELAMWAMEKADYVGLTHPNMSDEEMVDAVAEAAYNIQIQTGYGIMDLKEQNYGFRTDGSAFIFDFNYQDDEFTLEEYRQKVHNGVTRRFINPTRQG